MICRDGAMETLFAIGMMVGLMRSHGEPPKVAAAPVEQRQVPAEKHHPRRKSEWPLDY
jgi:hypothetical protein